MIYSIIYIFSYSSLHIRRSNYYYVFLLKNNDIKVLDLIAYKWLTVDPFTPPKFNYDLGVYLL